MPDPISAAPCGFCGFGGCRLFFELPLAASAAFLDAEMTSVPVPLDGGREPVPEALDAPR